MKKLFILLTIAALTPSFVSAQTLQCPTGQRVYVDYSTQFPREYCGPIENETGREPVRSLKTREDLSAACQQSSSAGNTINCSASEKAFLGSLITPPGIVSVGQCENMGGYWNSAGNPYKCELTPEAYRALNPSSNNSSSGQSQTSTAPSNNAPGSFCQNGVCLYTPLEPLPTANADAQSGRNFPAFVSALFRILITFGALFAVVMLVVAGISYMLSEAAVDISKAKDRAKAALWGLLLLTACWLILSTINPALIRFDLLRSLGQLSPNTTSGGAQTAPRSNASPTQQQIDQCGGKIRPLPQGGYDCA